MNTIEVIHLVHLLDGWAGARSSGGSSASTGHSTARHSSHVRHTAGPGSSSGRGVQLGDDGVADGLHLLLLLLELLNLGQLVSVQPLDGLIALVGHLLIVNGGLHVEAVALQTVLGGDPVLLLVVLVLELLGVVDMRSISSLDRRPLSLVM